jgi:hypothetical protein
MGFPILQPQQTPGHAFPPQLGVDVFPVGFGDHPLGGRGRLREEPAVKLVLVKRFREGPAEACYFGSAQVLPGRTVGDAAAAGDGPVALPGLPLQTKNFADLTPMVLALTAHG